MPSQSMRMTGCSKRLVGFCLGQVAIGVNYIIPWAKNQGELTPYKSRNSLVWHGMVWRSTARHGCIVTWYDVWHSKHFVHDRDAVQINSHIYVLISHVLIFTCLQNKTGEPTRRERTQLSCTLIRGITRDHRSFTPSRTFNPWAAFCRALWQITVSFLLCACSV